MRTVAAAAMGAAIVIALVFVAIENDAIDDTDEAGSGPAEALGERVDETVNDAANAVEDATE